MSLFYTLILSFSLLIGGIEIENLNPNEGEAGSNLTVELIANGVNFYDFYDSYGQVDGINFTPAGINVDSFSVSSETTITMNLNIDKIPAMMFDVELVGSFYDSYDQYFYDQYSYTVSKEDAFYVSSNNPLLTVNFDDNFGEVNVGQSIDVPMYLYNPSTVNLNVIGISMTSDSYSTTQTSFTVAPGQTLEEMINFMPTSNGSQNNTMTIYSNDEFDPVMVFQMSGEGFAVIGDLNTDGTLNILDIVALIGYVFNDNENPYADLNGDGTVNIVDVVMLVNLVLNWGL
ncbi:MAG: hypothetical protein CBB66_00455 [bacterium TMED6]|nr:MAG: hypothetical protein CBB66_00455 [bacterium TMED6]|tara:strand:+ start:1132 stop:1992 length:861 start_codon:yes stop_codon:yes gene_type:complete